MDATNLFQQGKRLVYTLAWRKRRKRWPGSEYLVCEPYRFVYCWIPKVACTTLKAWFVRLHGIEPDRLWGGQSDAHQGKRAAYHHQIHPFCQMFYLKRLPPDKVRDCLYGDRYFRFAIVRNPFWRLVSAYVDKSLSMEPCFTRLLDRYCGQPAHTKTYERGISFREFVGFVTSQDPLQLDPHWRPQHLFLGNNKFDFIGRFEELDAAERVIQETTGTKETFGSCGSIHGGSAQSATLARSVENENAQFLRKHASNMPSYSQFYTPQLIEQVSKYYREDFRRFGYDNRLRHAA